MRQLLFLIVSYAASVVGAICGIGGSVVIKPALDLLQLASVPAVSFLSGCTVLAMSGYSVVLGSVHIRANVWIYEQIFAGCKAKICRRTDVRQKFLTQ